MSDSEQDISRRTVLRTTTFGLAGIALGPMTTLAASNPKLVGGSGPLKRGSPLAEKVDPAGVISFINAVNSRVNGLHSMMLLRHGKVIAEGWWKPYEPSRPQVLYSLSKSFTSTAAGLAVSEGKLNVNDKVVSFFQDKL